MTSYFGFFKISEKAGKSNYESRWEGDSSADLAGVILTHLWYFRRDDSDGMLLLHWVLIYFTIH